MQEIMKKQQISNTLTKLQENFSNITELGCGTFSTVYQATHILTNLEVCLKVFEPSLPQKSRLNPSNEQNSYDETLELVENEILIMKKIDHPFIIKYYGTIFVPSSFSDKSTVSFPSLKPYKTTNQNIINHQRAVHIQIENTINQLSQKEVNMQHLVNIRVNKSLSEDINNSEKGTYIIVMELIKGITLLEFINKFGKIDEQEACRIFSQIVDAFYYLQSDPINVVHRDVKLENIMLDENYNVRVIDFGFSKSLNDQKDLLKTQCGSYPYSAPELLQNNPYTKAVDVWSLGVLLFAMINGCLPFEDANMSKLANKILYTKPKFLEDISHPCVELISRMLEKDPSKRANLTEVKEHEWMKMNNCVEYNDDFYKKFQNKRQIQKNLIPKNSQSVSPLISNCETIDTELQSKSQSEGNIKMAADNCCEIERFNLNCPTYIYDSLILHETSKALQKSNIQIIDELNLFDNYEDQYDIHKLIHLYKNDKKFQEACQTKMINRILENKNKSKKLNLLISLRMNNAHAQVLSNQELKAKLPILSLSPIKTKETQDAVFRFKKLGKQSNAINLMNNGQQQVIKLIPQKKPVLIFGKRKFSK